MYVVNDKILLKRQQNIGIDPIPVVCPFPHLGISLPLREL